MAFAELSGDYNPLHTDPIAARRTQFGECVAHGVFVLMWALDEVQKTVCSNRKWKRVSAKFLRPTVVGVPVQAIAEQKGPGQYALTVKEQGRILLQSELWLQDGEDECGKGSLIVDRFPPREEPQTISLADLPRESRSINLFWSSKDGERLFPNLAKAQSTSALAALIASTRIIGMKVPGEHSIYLQLDLSFATNLSAAFFGYRISEFRRSSQRLGIAVDGAGCEGLLWALVRPAPVRQPAMEVMKQLVPPTRFAGKRIIIVGGSRGLGETTSKLLAAGGAEVVVTYRVGNADARRVMSEINSMGGKATAIKLDTSESNWEVDLAEFVGVFDHVCYFATPPIAGGDGATLNQSLFNKFNEVYLSGLLKVAQLFAKKTDGAFGLFNASSVYVEEPPLRNLEYAASKAASEACCRWLQGAYPKARIHIARLPRLLTDQTASFGPTNNEDNIKVIFDELCAWILN